MEALHQLGKKISEKPPQLQVAAVKGNQANPWFTPEDIDFALSGIADQFLHKDKLTSFLQQYPEAGEERQAQTVGIVMAGNVPLVGFHDLLMTLLAGHNAMIKLSSKDEELLPAVINLLADIEPELAGRVQFVDRLQDFDAVIATGSNNTSRYFNYYFGKYPNIIRKNRNSVAALTGNETEEDFHQLSEDIFRYFGLGCRNVSKLYVPYDYDFQLFVDTMDEYRSIIDHEKYKHNYDYNRALLIMNEMQHIARQHLILLEDERLASPMAMLHYERYNNRDELRKKLAEKSDQIQAIVSREDVHEAAIPPGQTQKPELWDFPDDVDTMRFLLAL